jgi:hypothetical protein
MIRFIKFAGVLTPEVSVRPRALSNLTTAFVQLLVSLSGHSSTEARTYYSASWLHSEVK